MSSIGPEIPPYLLNQRHTLDDEDEGPTPALESNTSIGPQIPTSAGIGPEIPAHLLKGNTIHDDDEDSYGPSKPDDNAEASIGPQIPSHLLSNSTLAEGEDEDEEEDDYVPQLPPELAAQRAKKSSTPPPSASSSRRPLGPTLPSYAPTYDPNTYYEDEDDDDDDDVGPKPLPAGMQHKETNAVQEFIEREERRKKQLEEANNPKKMKRDEWMLVPPSSSDLLGNLDPTKIKKARQFSRNPREVTSNNDMSLWTETPQERQQRLADEVTGKKRKVTEQPVEDDGRKRVRPDEAFIRKGVDEHTKRMRGPALIEQHTSAHKGDEEKKDDAIWDHARDMALGGRLMDDSKRNQLIRESKGLSDRFGAGKSGGFL